MTPHGGLWARSTRGLAPRADRLDAPAIPFDPGEVGTADWVVWGETPIELIMALGGKGTSRLAVDRRLEVLMSRDVTWAIPLPPLGRPGVSASADAPDF